MCNSCEDCINAKMRKGCVRGIMDADPDEYWCEANEDFYYSLDDDEIIYTLKEEYINKLIEEGKSEEQAEKEAEEVEFEAECPSYSCYDPYAYEMDLYDGPYDTVKEKEEAMGYYD